MDVLKEFIKLLKEFAEFLFGKELIESTKQLIGFIKRFYGFMTREELRPIFGLFVLICFIIALIKAMKERK